MIKSLVIRSYPARYILSSKGWRASGVESHSVDGPSESVVSLCTKSLTCESAIPTSSMKDFPLIPHTSHGVIVHTIGDGHFPHVARIQLMSSPENTKEKHAKTNPKTSREIKWKQHRIITLWSTKVSCQACVVHSRSQKPLPLASMWAAIHQVKPSSNSVGPSNGCHLHSLESQVPKCCDFRVWKEVDEWNEWNEWMNANQNPLDLRCDLILDDFGISIKYQNVRWIAGRAIQNSESGGTNLSSKLSCPVVAMPMGEPIKHLLSPHVCKLISDVDHLSQRGTRKKCQEMSLWNEMKQYDDPICYLLGRKSD